MATRSTISKVYPNGTVKTIYCHWDGYPSNNGEILQEHYQDERKIDELLNLGSISSLKPKIGEKQSFESPEPGCVVAYHRDRGEELTITERGTADLFLADKEFHEEYNYIRRNGDWFVFTDRNNQVFDLRTVLEDIAKNNKQRPTTSTKQESLMSEKSIKKTRRRKPRSIVIIGRQWFRKTAGNSYQTCEIIVDGEPVHKSERYSGYSDQHTHNGLKWLRENEYIDLREHEAVWQFTDRTTIKVCSILVHVATESEL